MATKFSTSTNIIRDSERELKYFPTPNAIQVVNQISNDFKKGLRTFNIIGSYGTGKSSFLWAFEQTLKGKKKFFDTKFLATPQVDFVKLVGEFKSLKSSLEDYFNIPVENTVTENIFAEIFNRYHDLGDHNPLLFILIDEFGKFLEYASKNDPESELYFIQQFSEFVNNPENNIVLITTVHQNFDAYAIHLSAGQRQEWTKVKGRFKEITFNEPVEQLLFLAAEHLSDKSSKNHPTKEIKSLTELLLSSKAFQVNENNLRSISEKLFPLDVISAYVLTIAIQRYGQNERSLFSFLETSDETTFDVISEGKGSFYSIADVYDFLLQNYFSFLNSRYNPDFAAWKSIKTSIEKAESFFDENISAYEKLIKTIGLLSIYAQSGSKIDKIFLIEYSKKALKISNAEYLLEQLELKKIILYRNFNNRYILFEGTDLDIQSALYEAGSKIDDITDVVTLLQKYYSLPSILAKRAMYETGTPRIFEYVISSEPITTKPENDIDGFINLIFNENDITAKIKEISKENAEAILYCYYRNSKEIKDLLFEIEKTQKVIEDNRDDRVAVAELEIINIHQKKLLNHRILNNLYGDSSTVTWIFNGRLVDIKSQNAFNKYLSDICQEVYSATPYFSNELVNKHKISPSIHTAKRNYFKALANDWDMPLLGFPEDKFPPEKTIYLSLLENNSIKLYDSSSIDVIEPNTTNGFDVLWNSSLAFLESAKSAKRTLKDFVNILSDKPFKLKQGFIEFWIPTFIFIKRNDFALFNEGVYVPLINEDILERIAKVPEDFEVKSFALDGVKLDIFNSYRKFLNVDSKNSASNQSFIETIRPFLVFYRGLPDYSKETNRLSSESIAIRNAIANSKDPEQSFFEDFPTALGYSVAKIQKDRTALQNYILKLQDSIKEIRNCYDELINRFESFLQDVYFNSELSFEEYQAEFQKRFKNLQRHMLLPKQKSFVQRIDSHIEDKKAWLNSIAQSLVGKSLEKFHDEDEEILYAKFKEMIISLDSLEKISKKKFDENKEVLLDLQINAYGDELSHKIIRMPKTKNEDIRELQAEIKAVLSKDKSLNLAALAALLKDLMK